MIRQEPMERKRSAGTMTGMRRAVFATALMVAALAAPPPVDAGRGYHYTVAGNPADVTTTVAPGLALMGGGTDVDDAFRWLIAKSGGGDFVVIRARGSDDYNAYVHGLGGADSVETLVIQSRRAAADPFVIERIRNAEALFIAGGDQWNYVRLWKGTPVEDAIHAVVAKGAPVGGTSAGLAILGEFAFSAEHDTVTSIQALGDSYHRRVTLERDFLTLPLLARTITDSHFVERDRMGRSIAFLARILQDGWAPEVRGIAIDRETALLIEADGSVAIRGVPNRAAYMLRASGTPEVCRPDTPLTFRGVSVYRLTGDATFDLPAWTGHGGTEYTLSAVSGSLSSTQGNGSIY